MTEKQVTLAEALVAAQLEMPAVAKDSTNPHFRTRFVSLDHLIAETRPVLNRHGLSIQQFPGISDLGQPTLVTVFRHVSGERLEYAAPLYLSASTMQGLGAALTYARRYAWAAALGVASDDDDDGNQASARRRRRRRRRRRLRRPRSRPRRRRRSRRRRRNGCSRSRTT